MESLVAIHNHTHGNLDWLLRDVLPTLDYTIAIRQARQSPEEHLPPAEETEETEVLPGPPTNDQEMDHLEANV